MNVKKSKGAGEPLFQISRRDAIPLWKSYCIRAAAILIALLISGILSSILTKANIFTIYKAFFVNTLSVTKKGKVIFSVTKVWNILQDVAVLLCVALALTPAFKMRFWNIGAEGQVLMGAFGCSLVMILLTGKIPVPILFVLMIVLSVLFGALWGVIPAIFKAFFGTNETLFTLMMNYVAAQLITFCILHFGWGSQKGMPNTGVFNLIGSNRRVGWFPYLFGQQYLLNILIVAVLTYLLYIYLRYSKHGYEISVVGESENTARYIGINVKKVIIRTMILSGALCGIAGLILVAGTDHALSANTAGGRGFTAIMVTWLAHFNPAYMALTTFLIIFVERGSMELSTAYSQISDNFASVLVGIVLFFIIGCEFFINYKVKIRLPWKRKEETAQ